MKKAKLFRLIQGCECKFIMYRITVRPTSSSRVRESSVLQVVLPPAAHCCIFLRSANKVFLAFSPRVAIFPPRAGQLAVFQPADFASKFNSMECREPAPLMLTYLLTLFKVEVDRDTTSALVCIGVGRRPELELSLLSVVPYP